MGLARNLAATDCTPPAMDNADLEKLKVSAGKLQPKFKASYTNYSVTVGSSVAEIKLTILTSDSGASYDVKVS